MKKGSKILLFLFMLSALPLIYGVIIPAKIRSDVPSMTRYLDKEGYPHSKYKSCNSLTYQVNFTSDSGEVSVRYSRNGLFQIVY